MMYLKPDCLESGILAHHSSPGSGVINYIDALTRAAELEFVKVGNVEEAEGSHAWQQMCKIAVDKEPQYLEGEQNILIFVCYSDALGLLLETAVNEFNDIVYQAGDSSSLRKLGGMMKLQCGDYIIRAQSNVEFIPTQYPLRPITSAIASVLGWGQFA